MDFFGEVQYILRKKTWCPIYMSILKMLSPDFIPSCRFLLVFLNMLRRVIALGPIQHHIALVKSESIEETVQKI